LVVLLLGHAVSMLRFHMSCRTIQSSGYAAARQQIVQSCTEKRLILSAQALQQQRQLYSVTYKQLSQQGLATAAVRT
jgi:hypothetical protein